MKPFLLSALHTFLWTFIALCLAGLAFTVHAAEDTDVVTVIRHDNDIAVIQRGSYGCEKGENAVTGSIDGKLRHGCATPGPNDTWTVEWAGGGYFSVPPAGPAPRYGEGRRILKDIAT